MMYTKFDLSSPSLAYVRDVLAAGNTLARRLLELRDLNAGSVFAYLPAELNASAIANYAYAVGAHRQQSLNYLAHFLASFLASHKCGVCVIEDRYSRKSDPGLRNCRSKMVNFNDEVYFPIGGSEVSEDLVMTALREADTAMSLVVACAMTSYPSSWSSQADLSLSAIEQIAGATEHLAIEAFDGEGFIIWSALKDA